MQSVCKVRSRLEGFLGHFFLSTAGILTTSPQRRRTAQDSSASTAAQDSPGLLGVRGGTGQPRFSYTGQFGHSFNYSFSYRIFLEQLCFSIDSSISSLL